MDPGPHGHPDQVAYIVTWEAMAYDPPPWFKPFTTPKSLVTSPPSMSVSSPSAPTLPPPLLPVPPARSSLYPILTKTPQENTRTKPPPVVLPQGEDLLVDLLTEDPLTFPSVHPSPYEAAAPPEATSAEVAPAEPAPSPVAASQSPPRADSRRLLTGISPPGRSKLPASILTFLCL